MSDPPARKRLGQHFLVDRGASERIVAALEPHPGEAVLEIGPGRGALTDPLIERCGRIAAVELDRVLSRALRQNHGPDRLLLLEQDVLQLDLGSVAERLSAPGAPLVLVGNLPYNISKPVAGLLVRQRSRIERAVLMFQREVAMRLCAREGGGDYGPLTVLVGEAFEVRRLFDLPPGSFRPRPRVISTVTAWRRREREMSERDERRLRSCLAACFAARRKTLRNNLRASLGSDSAAESLLREAGLDGGRRAESVAPEGFRRLARLWPEG